MQAVGARMLVRHEFGEIGAVERPGVDDLLAMGVDDRDNLPSRDKDRLAAPRWNFDGRESHVSISRPESNHVDLDNPAARKGRHADRGSGWTPAIGKIAREDFIHLRVIAVEVGQEDADANDVGDVIPQSPEYAGEIIHHLERLSLDAGR
jgi:hypothetical protein